MTTTDIAVKALDRAYDEQYALVGLNAIFPAGTITALLGPNGAGKSSLMGILSTLARPSAGSLYFGDVEVVAGARSIRQQIGYVGHKTMLYDALTARENLLFFGRLYGLPDLDARADALLDRVGLPLDKDRPVEGFSRGMAQRLTLARVLLHDPPVLLLDEPLTGLDRAGIDAALDLFAERRDAGSTVIVASHDLEAIGRVADRALILRNGRKVYEGPTYADLEATYHRHVGVT